MLKLRAWILFNSKYEVERKKNKVEGVGGEKDRERGRERDIKEKMVGYS